MSDMFEMFGNLAESLTKATEPIFEAYVETMQSVARTLTDAFAPLLARAKPYETGRELAEVVADNRLTAAERYPVRAVTTYDQETIDVEYDDGSGFEQFVTYRKEAVRDE